MTHPVRDFRVRQKLSQAALAKLVGVSRAMVGLVETGDRRIAAEDVVAWEKATGIPRAKLRPDIFGKGI